MALRIFGWCLVVVGVGLAIFLFRTLSDASDMGRFMAEAGDAFGQPIDAQHWSWRWRVNGIGLANIAAGCVLSGLSFVARHRYAWAVLSVTLAANVAWLFAGRGLGSREYAFETTMMQMAATAILAIFCGWRLGGPVVVLRGRSCAIEARTVSDQLEPMTRLTALAIFVGLGCPVPQRC